MPGNQVGHSSRGDSDHFGADGAVVALRLFEDPLGRQFVRAHRVAHLLGEQLGAQPSVALAPRQYLVAEVALEAVHLSARTLSGRAQPWQHGGDRTEPHLPPAAPS